MTHHHRDPIEDWLSQDVEVLPPQPGAFQRVRRRARRRKAVQAVSVAAGVAVIVAAGLSVPALTGNLFQGRPGPANLNTARPTASGPANGHRPAPSASPRSFSGPALSHAGRGASAPAGFRPSSVTFVGNRGRYLGAVLGQAPCQGRTCIAMAGTATYGNGRWTRVGAPPAGPSSVSQVRFADAENGWAFGPALWATHNGGASWARISGVTGRVADLATIDGRVLAVAATGCTGTGTVTGSGTSYTEGCTGFGLYAAAATRDHFARVLSRPGGGQVTPGALQLQSTGQAGYLIAGGRLYSGALDGSGWSAVPPGPASAPDCLTGHGTGNPAVLAPGAQVLYAACATGQRLVLYRSASSGRTWQAAGRIAAAGTAMSLAVSPAGTLVLATTKGLYYSLAAGPWHLVGGSAVGVAFRYVGMTTSQLGVAVPATSALGTLFVTGDGGRTWRASPISR